MKILRKNYCDTRDAWIDGYKEGAKAVLNDTIAEASKNPKLKYNGKALQEMINYIEEMEEQLPEMAEESVEERNYSVTLQSVIEEVINNVDTMKIGHFEVINDKSSGSCVCISGGLNGRGIWSNYFETLSKLMFQLELRYPDAYVEKLINDSMDDVFYLYVRVPKDESQEKSFSKGPKGRDIVPESIVKKVKAGEGVIQKYRGEWRIVSMKTNPPTFWDSHYKTREDAEAALRAYQANKRS